MVTLTPRSQRRFSFNRLFGVMKAQDGFLILIVISGLSLTSFYGVNFMAEPHHPSQLFSGPSFNQNYTSREEQDGRRERFPSVQDRVKIYMGAWYTPPCDGNDQAKVSYKFVQDDSIAPSSGQKLLIVQELERNTADNKGKRVFVMSEKIRPARTFYYNREAHIQCATVFKQAQQGYCLDTAEYMVPVLDRLGNADTIPTLLQFGDAGTTIAFTDATLDKKREKWPHIPVIKKFRASFAGGMETIRKITSEKCVSGKRKVYDTARGPVESTTDIVWRLTSKRHYGAVPGVASLDIPWSQKKDQAVFRGAMTGMLRDGVPLREKKKLGDKENCLSVARCRLVYTTSNSALVDAGLTSKIRVIPETIKDVTLVKPPLDREAMLKYKAIIMLEGNDISSGFKWALASNSVVLTQAPTKTSWAMEEVLEPWVHYVPLNDELSDVEEKMQWVIDHDKEAQEIARQGALWIFDLLFHPDSYKDDELVNEEILRRYRAHFRISDDLSLPTGD